MCAFVCVCACVRACAHVRVCVRARRVHIYSNVGGSAAKRIGASFKQHPFGVSFKFVPQGARGAEGFQKLVSVKVRTASPQENYDIIFSWTRFSNFEIWSVKSDPENRSFLFLFLSFHT